MRTIKYSKTPNPLKWKLDSTDPSPFVYRNRDKVLNRIDSLVKTVEKAKDGGEKLYLLNELFFAINYWLSNYNHNPTMSKARKPAMSALFAYVAHELCSNLDCTVNVLPRELENAYGRELTQHGRRVDEAEGLAQYLNRAQAAKYKLIFKRGLAYMSNWDEPGAEPRLKKANSEIVYDKTMGASNTLRPGYANCVMSMGRDIYMANHLVCSKEGSKQGFYHSSYLSGLPTQYAGSMQIIDGVVSGVQCNSGHYKTTDFHTVNILEHLLTLGVNLKNVDVFNFKGRAFQSRTTRATNERKFVWSQGFGGNTDREKDEAKKAYAAVYDAVDVSGVEYLECHGNWDAVLQRHGLNLDNFHELQDPRRMLHRLKTNMATVEDLIQERFEQTKTANRAMGIKFRDQTVWNDAYKEVCMDLSLVDPTWTQKWNKPPPPMPAATPPPQQTRRPPPRPASRPPPRRRPVTS